MAVQIEHTIKVIDDHGLTVMSFSKNTEGLAKLLPRIICHYDAFMKEDSNENLYNLCTTVALYKKIFDTFDWSIEKNDVHMVNMIMLVEKLYDDFQREEHYSNSKLGNIFNECSLIVRNYHFNSNYDLSNIVINTDADVFNLKMDLISSKADYECEEFDDEEEEEDDITLDELGYVFEDEECEQEEEEDDILTDSSYHDPISFPLHPAMLKKLTDIILTQNDQMEMAIYIVYAEKFISELEDNFDLFDYINSLHALKTVIYDKKALLRRITTGNYFDEIYDRISNDAEFTNVLVPSIYNDCETYFAEVFGHFLDCKNKTFFDDLKNVLKRIDSTEVAENDYNYLLREFERILRKYRLNIEVECLKHHENEVDAKELAEDICYYYESFTRNRKFKKTFKHKQDDNNLPDGK